MSILRHVVDGIQILVGFMGFAIICFVLAAWSQVVLFLVFVGGIIITCALPVIWLIASHETARNAVEGAEKQVKTDVAKGSWGGDPSKSDIEL